MPWVGARATVVALAGVALSAGAATPASAATVRIDGRTTTLAVTSQAAGLLEDNDITLAPIGPARATNAGIVFPIGSGRIDPATGVGTVAHAGGLRLRGGGTRVRLTDPRLDTDDGTLSMVISGRRRALFTVSLADASIERPGAATTVGGVAVRLSRLGARTLNGAFGTGAFRRGTAFGTATVRAIPTRVLFRGGDTALAFDPALGPQLQALGLGATPVAPARFGSAGALRVPVAGGNVSAQTLAGTISHRGGLSLVRTDGVTVTMRRFIVDTSSPARTQLTAVLNGGERVPVLRLDLTDVATQVAPRTVIVGPVPATLTQAGAEALNGAFQATAFARGQPWGQVTITGQTA